MSNIIHFDNPKPIAKVKTHSYNNTDYYTDLNEVQEIKTPFLLDEYKQDLQAVIRLLARYIVPYLVVFCYCSSVPLYLLLGVHFIINDVYFLGVSFLLMLTILTFGFVFWVYIAKNRMYYK